MKRDNYFFVISVVLLLLVVIGFSPSFYLRPLSDKGDLPFTLIIHGLSCTAWFLVIVLQSYWIKSGKTIRHSQMGMYFTLLAPVLVISGLYVIAFVTDEYHANFSALAAGAEVGKEQAFRALIITGDLIQLFLFLGFVYVGYRFRSQVQVHKRAMTIASILICQQALVRIGKFDFFMIGDDPGASGGIYATFVPLLLLLSLVVYDILKWKRPKHISIWGIVSYVLFVATAFALNMSGIAVGVLEALR